MQSDFHIVPNMISGMVLAILIGVAAAGMTLWWFGKRRATSRIIDLASFTVAGVGLATSIFAIASYEQRVNDAAAIVNLSHSAMTAVERIHSIIDDNCPKHGDSDCDQIYNFYVSLLDLDFVRGTLIPSLSGTPLPKSNEAMKALFEIRHVVFEYNFKANDILFFQQKRFWSSIENQGTAIIWAAYTVSFAFGMGWMRRAYDATNTHAPRPARRPRRIRQMRTRGSTRKKLNHAIRR